ncbi:hypothetical protein [Cysteiniphilum sp. 6C5]
MDDDLYAAVYFYFDDGSYARLVWRGMEQVTKIQGNVLNSTSAIAYEV